MAILPDWLGGGGGLFADRWAPVADAIRAGSNRDGGAMFVPWSADAFDPAIVGAPPLTTPTNAMAQAGPLPIARPDVGMPAAPMSLAPPQAAPAEGDFFDRLNRSLASNSNLLIGLGGDIMSGNFRRRGLPNALAGAALDKKQTDPIKGISMGDRLVNPVTGQVMADFSGAKKPDFKTEQDLRKEFENNAKPYLDQRRAYERILAAKDDAAGDLALIFSYMKMLDPGSAVRETEFANAQNAAGVPDQIRNLYNRIRSGERLNSDQRAMFKQQAFDIFETQETEYTSRADQMRGIAESHGITPERVIPKLGPAPRRPELPYKPGTTLSPNPIIQEGMTATNPQTGQKVIFKNGQWVPVK